MSVFFWGCGDVMEEWGGHCIDLNWQWSKLKERKLMMWNPLTPVFIIFIGFYSIRYSSDCQGKPRRITVKVVLDVGSFLNTQEDERRRCHPRFSISPPFTSREPESSLRSLQPHANMLSHSIWACSSEVVALTPGRTFWMFTLQRPHQHLS